MASKPTDLKTQVREQAEGDLEAFIRLIHPQRVLGGVHSELISWWTRDQAKSHQLTLLPRDHQKSALIAYRAVWEITRNPAIRIIYLSSTSNLATKQLKFIKDILLSDTYRYYWPDMVNVAEGQREKWTESEISVDHPKRKYEAVRDPTLYTAGLTTSFTGLHFDIAILDDVVVMENAYTDEGRKKVETQYSLLASVSSTDAMQWVVGTRYHPRDLYQKMVEMNMDIFSDEGEVVSDEPIYEIFERQVESRGDGSGEFLWPRQQRYDGRWFGFDQNILAKKRAQYLDRIQFRAQYYNNPNDAESSTIREFQYYERHFITRDSGKWYFKGRRINVFAAVDFAFSRRKRADSTAIVVVGVDSVHNFYILEIDRFKTDMISDYFDHILRLHQKWDFRKIRAEVTAAQEIIVKDLKENYIRPQGLSLIVDPYRPTRNEGSKEERIEATLQPRYKNKQIYHYLGGNCQVLEEELILQNPSHDDVKDCLASCIEICVAPINSTSSDSLKFKEVNQILAQSRFGGIR